MNDGDQSDGFGDLFSGIPVFAQVFIAVVMVLIVLVVVFVVVSSVKNWRALKKAGVDPLAAHGQLAGQLANSELLCGDNSRRRIASASSTTCVRVASSATRSIVLRVRLRSPRAEVSSAVAQ